MPSPKKSLQLFAACAPGLEPLLAGEVAGLTGDSARADPPGAAGSTAPAPTPAELEVVSGGVEFRGDAGLLYRANLELGVALKVLLRLARFRAADFARLEREAAAVDWAAWLPDGAAVRVRATCSKSRLYHSGAVAERVRGAIAKAVRLRQPPRPGHDGGGEAASGEHGEDHGEDHGKEDHGKEDHGKEDHGKEDPAEHDPVFDVHARLVRDTCTLSLDTSGVSLHKRGYRLETGKAPLREDLARALLVTSGWDRQRPVVDPFCGSGTIAIEAGLLARNAAPGRARPFAFLAAPTFDPELWNRVRRDAAARERSASVDLWASDRDAGAVEATRRNAERAGIDVRADLCPLSAAPAWEALAGDAFFVATNPPFGARVARGRDLLPLYQTLARLVRERPGASLALVASDDRLVRRAKLPVERTVTTSHGGKKIGLYANPERTSEAGY